MKLSRFILPLLTAASATTGSQLFARDLAPDYWLEDITATDGSVQKCLVFRTVAGVDYQVETSEDLSTWSTQSEIYGLGHEFVVPVHQSSPPPPPAPGAPPPAAAPTKNVTFRMQRASGSAGGTVVSKPPPTKHLVPWG